MAPAPQVASEADFDTEEANKAVDAANATKIKDQIEDGGKASDGNQIDNGAKDTDANQLDDDGAKATDANQLDDGAKPSDDNTANSKSIVNAKASEAKDVVDKKGIEEKKTSAEADDQDWGNWQRSWDKKKETQSLSYNGKEKLNKEMRELVRPVHVGSLAYVLPDKAKKCCLTWRAAVDLHLGATGKRPTWSSHFIECKICHRFSTSEREFEEDYAAHHVGHVDLQPNSSSTQAI